jgi:hypothetical protein
MSLERKRGQPYKSCKVALKEFETQIVYVIDVLNDRLSRSPPSAAFSARR